MKQDEENYTIVDWIRYAGYHKTISNAPYELTEDDLKEIQNEEYLVTRSSIKRIVLEIVKANNINDGTRKRKLVDQRRYLYYILKKRAGFTYEAIGLLFHKDHATVIHSLKKIQDLDKDIEYNETISYLKEFFNNPIYIDL